MQRKTLSRFNLNEVFQRKYTHCMINDSCFQGEVALLQFIKVSHPLLKRKRNKDIYIIKENAYWLQLAPYQENIWLTVIIDEQGNITEYYFDITDGNHIIENGDSYFDDLYLDVVMNVQKDITVLDEDELEIAYKNQDITYQQYQKALATKDHLISFLQKNKENIDSYCLSLFQLLKTSLE